MKAATVANAVLFQVSWIAFVWSAARDDAWLGFVALAVLAAVTLVASARRAVDLELVAITAVAGFALDSAFAASGLVVYHAPVPARFLAPVWIVGLWIAFALTLNHSLAFLQRKPLVAAAFGAIGGPLSYAIAAHAWGAIDLATPTWMPLVALGCAWALVTPALAELAHVLANRARRRRAAA